MPYAPIEGFFDQYHFLSNFSEEGGVQPTVEHWYQAAKTEDAAEIEFIMSAETPGLAKKRGRRCTLVSNWEEIKIDVMRDLLYDKFEEPEIRAKLVATNPRELVEVNDWGDDFWGFCTEKGQNHLGKLLEEVRQWCLSITPEVT